MGYELDLAVEIFSSCGLLVGAVCKISQEMRCCCKIVKVLYSTQFTHIRMPSPSVLEPLRVSEAGQVSLA